MLSEYIYPVEVQLDIEEVALDEARPAQHDWKDAIDYPVSWTFWRAWCRQHGEDPGPCEPEDVPSELHERLERLEELQATEPWTRPEWNHVRQLKAQILFLENKLNEHIDKPKKAQKQLKAIEV